MFKKLDRYIIKTFFGPFFFIFSVLFFIFIVNIIWIQMSQFIGKGLSYYEIAKLLFYMGVSVVSLVLPLTILLSSIMTFGELGERYELAAMKAAGISLNRVMMPLFMVTMLLSALLFLFQNNISPSFQRKAKNMIYNIAATRPALKFTAGQFVEIPGSAVKFDKISGKNGENLEGVTVKKIANAYQDQQTIVAKKGKFVPAADNNFLKLMLYNGYVYTDHLENKEYKDRLKQPDEAIKFDTLTTHFDVSELINKAIESEKITDDYRFQTYWQINKRIEQLKTENDTHYSSINNDLINQTNSYVSYIDKSKTKTPVKEQNNIAKVTDKKKRLEALFNAYKKIETLKSSEEAHQEEAHDMVKYNSQVVMYQQRIFAYSFTCIIFFLIGASLGSIVRKGGFGLPVVIAIFIFIIFYVMNLSVENLSWAGKLDPYLAAWLPNAVLFPLGIWLVYKALTDSQLFDVEKYKTLLKPITKRFVKNREHARYQ